MFYRVYIYKKEIFSFTRYRYWNLKVYLFLFLRSFFFFGIVRGGNKPFPDPDKLHFIWYLAAPLVFLNDILPPNAENVTVLVWLTKV